MDNLVHAAQPTETAVDPVCGMTVDPAAARHRRTHQGETYYFCSEGCGAKFAADPARYLQKQVAPDIHDHTHHRQHQQAAPAKAVPAGTIYTCPMHPQIRQLGPGSCPICGMALEPEVVTGGGRRPIPNSST